MVAHVLLIELRDRLALVDSGLGSEDIAEPQRRLGLPFLTVVRPALDPNETVRAQIERLGYSASDVSDILPTHLDLDHAGGLSDFPNARVHVAEEELAAFNHPWLKRRYRRAQLAHGPRWVPYSARGERWFDFEAVRSLPGLPPEILAIPLFGHSPGHAGIAISTPSGWLLHCGDAYFHHRELEGHSAPAAIELFQSLAAFDARLRRENRARLAALSKAHGEEVRLFSAHDPAELA